MIKILFIELLLLIGSCCQLQAQRVLKGRVISTNQEPMPGVNVTIKGTPFGVVTDIDGKFTFKEPKERPYKLTASFIGYKERTIWIDKQETVRFKLSKSDTELDEVVAIGYGSMKKKDLTGSVASVNIKEMEKVPVNDVAQAMAGRMPGVQITSSEGSPGADMSIKIRGGGSITQSNEPLYIIDGFPSEDGLSTLDPTDIESIDVLKDASSTSIYGARGANGVVVISTKGGVAQKTTVNLDVYFGINKVSKTLDVLNPKEFVQLDYERTTYGQPYLSTGDPTVDYQKFINRYGAWDDFDKIYNGREGVDWQDECFGRNALVQNYKVSINGGSKATRYNISLSHLDNQGIMVHSGFKRTNAKVKLDLKANKKLSISTNVNFTDQLKYGSGTSSGNEKFNRLSQILTYRPTIGKDGNDEDLINMDEDPALEDEDGNASQNPLVSAGAETRDDKAQILALNLDLTYKVTRYIDLKITGGWRIGNKWYESFDDERSLIAKRQNVQGYIRTTRDNSWDNTNILSYNRKLGKHSINIMLGNEQTKSVNQWVKSMAADFPNGDIGLNDMGLASSQTLDSYRQESTLLSFFGRSIYNYHNRYLATFSLRADGSSKFGKNNKWGYFPSGSLAWRISQEPFTKKWRKVSNLKLRLSAGQSGNNRIGNYNSLSTLSSTSYPFDNGYSPGVSPDRIPNSNLKWETSTQLDLGLDLGLWDERIQFVADIYQNSTKDLLLNAIVPYTTGYSTMLENIGKTRNRGLELSLTTVNIKHHSLEWRTTFNISFDNNKVIQLVGKQDFFYMTSNWGLPDNDYLVQVGKPVGIMYGYKTEGLYQIEDFNYTGETYQLKSGIPFDPNNYPKPGYWKFKDVDGDGKITPEDRTEIGNATPKFYGGINNSITWKNFDFSLFLNFSYGGDIYNANKLYNTLADRDNKNTLGLVKDRWQTLDNQGLEIKNPETLSHINEGKKVATTEDMSLGHMKLHSWVIEKGSFLRINNLSLGYTLPKKSIKYIDNLRIYTTMNNLYTFTQYSGYDPEVSTRNSSGLTPNVDFGGYPRSRSFIFGINLSL